MHQFSSSGSRPLQLVSATSHQLLVSTRISSARYRAGAFVSKFRFQHTFSCLHTFSTSSTAHFFCQERKAKSVETLKNTGREYHSSQDNDEVLIHCSINTPFNITVHCSVDNWHQELCRAAVSTFGVVTGSYMPVTMTFSETIFAVFGQ